MAYPSDGSSSSTPITPYVAPIVSTVGGKAVYNFAPTPTTIHASLTWHNLILPTVGAVIGGSNGLVVGGIVTLVGHFGILAFARNHPEVFTVVP